MADSSRAYASVSVRPAFLNYAQRRLELLLGFQTSEEVIDTIDVTATANGTLDQKVTEAQALIATTPVTTVDMPAPAIKVQSESERVSVAVAPETKVAQKRQPSF